jgi:tetratricopeptide (TPR) repeat protein
MPEPLDDRLDTGASFDPHQWIVHGLLSVYFEPSEQRDRRTKAILARAYATPLSPKRQRGVPAGGTGVPAGESAPSWPRGSLAPWLRTAPSLALRALARHPRRTAGVALAAVLLAVCVTWLATGRREPLTKHLLKVPDFAAVAEAAIAQPLPMTGSIGDPLMLCGLDFGPTGQPATRTTAGDGLLVEMLASLNCGGLPDRLAAIEQARRERDEYLDAMQSAVASGDREQAIAYHSPVMFAWTRVYRPLRDLGHFAEAIAEVQRALAWASGENPLGEPWRGWHRACLNDLAESLEAMGDYEGARRVHLESVELRKAYLRTDPGYVGDPDIPDLPPSPSPARQFYGGELVPPYLRLSWLAVLRGGRDGLSEARQWQDKAEFLLRRFFGRVCAANGILLPPEATLLDDFARSPPEFQHPDESWFWDPQRPPPTRYHGFLPDASVVAWLRCCLFNAARLQRVAGDYAAAAATLEQLASIRAYPCNDEWRLDFYEPLEVARVSLLQGCYRAALQHLEVARQTSGPRACPFEEDLNENPVGPLALAEVELLHGVALLGGNIHSPDGRRLIEQSIAVAGKMSGQLEGQTRSAFLDPFTRWNDMLTRVAQ